MEVGKLTVQARNQFGKGTSRRLRTAGLVPGVCYGPGVEQPLAITINPKELKASLDPVKRRNTVIEVTVEDPAGGKSRLVKAMLRDFQIDFLRRVVTHVDLLAIDLAKEIEVEVPVTLVGKAPGVLEGGQIHVERLDVEIRCKPEEIPTAFDLDISGMNVGDVLHVSDLQLPEGVSTSTSGHLAIVAIVAPKADKVDETAEVVPAEGEAAVAAGGEKKD